MNKTVKLVTIPEAAKIIGISRSLALQLANAEIFKHVYYKRLSPRPIYLVRMDEVEEVKKKYWAKRSPEARRKAQVRYGC